MVFALKKLLICGYAPIIYLKKVYKRKRICRKCIDFRIDLCYNNYNPFNYKAVKIQ